MKKYAIPEISEDVFYVGSKDPDLRKFDALVHLPYGTSYNSYLVKGGDKTALIDTVAPGFQDEFLSKLRQITDINKIDYVVMNHAEADHASAIPHVMEASPATLLTSPKGAKMAERFFGVNPDRIKIVDFNKTIDLGVRTLRFIDAPWLHWPETMFTYIPENKILFSGDFFGGHVSYGIFDGDVDNAIPAAKSYFAEIMLPFKNWGRKALDKIAELDIAVVAPTHGPVYKNVRPILENCAVWCSGETAEKALVAYATIWGGSGEMAKIIAESLKSEGIDIKLYNMGNTEFSEISADLIDSRGLVLVTPTILGNMHPMATLFMNIVKLYKAAFKYGAIITSYGWAKSATKHAAEAMETAKIEILGSVEVNGPPLEEDIKAIQELGKNLARRIIEN
ncbi:MAG: FprA family A-type flavoprotein [Candidatus Zixiibacteriota bacterium]|nr:MAG: FprA family A-type flavoprotein [candidate division Zixibacteria bacterium]